jgi:23S rRNA A2030 N6-methylase RlmJ
MQGTGFFIINAPINMKRDVSNGLDILLEILKDPIETAKINYNVF